MRVAVLVLLMSCGFRAVGRAEEPVVDHLAAEPPLLAPPACALPRNFDAVYRPSELAIDQLAAVAAPNYLARPWYLTPYRHYSYYRPWYTYGYYGPTR